MYMGFCICDDYTQRCMCVLSMDVGQQRTTRLCECAAVMRCTGFWLALAALPGRASTAAVRCDLTAGEHVCLKRHIYTDPLLCHRSGFSLCGL